MQTFEFEATATRQGKVDAENGVIYGVSVISTPEAKGHGIKIDAASIASFHEVTKEKQIKAFYTHDDNEALDAIGFWENFEIIEDGEFTKLQADFVALDAWKKHHTHLYDSLFEMAEKAPESFGVSAEFSGKAIYYSEDGEEIDFKHGEDDDKEIYARALEVSAFSIVAQPAANPTGLFSEPIEVDEDEVDAEEFLSFNLAQVQKDLDEALASKQDAIEANEILEKGFIDQKDQIAELQKELEAAKTETASWQCKYAQLCADMGSEPVQAQEEVAAPLNFEQQLAAATSWSEKNELFKNNMFKLVADWNK